MKFLLSFLLAILIYTPSMLASQDELTLVLISHKAAPDVTIDDVTAFYTMKKKLLNNNRKAVLLAQDLDGDASIRFFREVFESYPYQFKRKWDVSVFSGRAKRPVMLNNNSEVTAFINENKDAIGYLLIDFNQIETIKENFNVIATYP